jgi:hypothetical protein
MATDPSEILGFQTKKPSLEIERPDLRLVRQIDGEPGLYLSGESDSELEKHSALMVEPANFGATLLEHFEIDDSRYGVAPVFLAGVNEVVPPYIADIYEKIIQTGDTEALIFAAKGIPQGLKRAIEIKRQGNRGLGDDQMDRLREMWGGLFACEEEVSELAYKTFQESTPRLLEEDISTYHWVGGMACRQFS